MGSGKTMGPRGRGTEHDDTGQSALETRIQNIDG
jgi:hypothetical protein